MSARSLVKHYGPGPHPGTGTPQTVHAPGGGVNVPVANEHLRSKHAEVLERFGGGPGQLVFEAGVNPPFWSWLVRDVQSVIYEDGNEAIRDEWGDRVDALMRDLRQLEKENERDLFNRLAVGEITAEEVINLGGAYKGQQEIRDLGELPRTLYHVTTDTSAILETGLKSRDELGQGRGVGLGGGTADTISFTSSPEVAEGILFSMRERHAVLNDPATEIPRLIEEAKQGHNADRPWWGGLETKWDSESADILSQGGINGLLKGEAIYVASNNQRTVEELREYFLDSRVSYFRDKYDIDSIELVSIPEGPTLANMRAKPVFKLRYTPAGHAEAIGDFMDEYSVFRDSAGGPMDPLFISNDDLAFKNLDPDDFSILKGTTIEGAKGYQLSSMGEWRTWSGDVLESMEVLK